MAVPSVRPAAKVWRRLGFQPWAITSFAGCPGFNVHLEAASVRVVAGSGSCGPPLLPILSERLLQGPGLVGWTWACRDLATAQAAIEQRSGIAFAADATDSPLSHAAGHVDGDVPEAILVPATLTPGAATFLEASPVVPHVSHPNRVHALDHVVLGVSDVDATVAVYEQAFALHARRTTMQERAYGYLKVGDSVLEIVGPATAGAGPVQGGLWGLAFRSEDLDETVAWLKRKGIGVSPAREAVQGGRIASILEPVAGVRIAFLGE